MMKDCRKRLDVLVLMGLFLVGCHRPAAADPAVVAEQSAAGGQGESVGRDGGSPGRVLTPTDLKVLTWRSVGPANMGGRVADIALAPGNAKTFFVGYATGGLFKTTNNGTSFSAVFDKYETACIGSVVVADAPVDWVGWADEKPDAKEGQAPDLAELGRGKIVWVGTGEGNGRNSSSWGHGVYRSTDGGSTFVNVGLVDSHDVPRLAVDPRDPEVCYAACLGHLWGPNAERGLFKTVDGGKSWTGVLQIDENTGCCDVILDPGNPDTVYAALYARRRTAYSFQSGGPDGGIYKSTDAGATWTQLTQGLPEQMGRIGLDVWLKDPQVLYAVIESDGGGWGVSPWDDRSKTGGVFRTDDGGATWTRMNRRNPRPFYFSKIRIDPANDQRIYLLSTRLGVSDDGGRHFRAGAAKAPHVDHHAMVIDPQDADHVLLGNDGGLYASYDAGKTWDFMNGLAVGQFYNIAVDMSDPYRIGGGLQDNGSWIGPSATIHQDSGEFMGKPVAITNHDWWFVNNGDGFHVAFDPTDANIVYAESQGGELVRIHLDSGRRKRIKPSPKEGQARFRFNWNAPFFISPHSATTLYLGGNYVFKLTDRGERWERISEDLSTRAVEKIETVGSDAETHCTVVALAESPLAAGLLWAGTDDGRIHLTVDDGKNWQDVTPPQVHGRYISKIEPSHLQRETAYAAVDGHRSDDMDPLVLMTADSGQSWSDITGDLPKGASVKVIREDPRNSNVLYAGTERGCYVSVDRGGRWIKLNGKSLPTVAVDDLVVHPRERDLVVGTHGRSIYVMDNASVLAALTDEVVGSAFHLFEPMPAKPRIFLPYWGIWGDRMFVANNPKVGARIDYWIDAYTGEDVSISITDVHDAAIRKLKGTNHPGVNRVIWDLQYEKHDRYGNPDDFLNQTQFVPAGDYTVSVSFGERKAKTTVTVLPGPPEYGADAEAK